MTDLELLADLSEQVRQFTQESAQQPVQEFMKG